MSASPADAAFLDALATGRTAMNTAVDFISEHRELAHEEFENSRYIADRLEGAGYIVERGIAAMPTAFRAEIQGSKPGRRVGVVAVYDAVTTHRADGSTEAVHSCGHAPVSAGILGAALALATMRDQLGGSFVVVGCPADEIHSLGTRLHGSGKAVTAAAGVWDDVDVALYAHPEFVDTVWQQSLWMIRETAILSGQRSLNSDVESRPLTALRELLAASESSDPASLMIETAILDGDVEDGVGLNLTVRLLAFSSTQDGLDEILAPAHRILADAEWSRSSSISAIRPDPAVTAVMADAFKAAGRTMLADPPSLPFATDFGNVSRRIPAALIGVGRAEGWGFHRDRGVAEFAGDDGKDLAESIAEVVGLATLRLTELPSPPGS